MRFQQTVIDRKVVIELPKEFENIEVEIVINPIENDFWSDEELDNFGEVSMILASDDLDEDYSSW
jgi:hypothetical protein